MKEAIAARTNWPRVGGRDFEPAPTSLFNSEAFREAYQPGGHTRAIYFGACEGLANISRELHLPLYKVGACASGHIHARMRELKIAKYGAVSRIGDEYYKERLQSVPLNRLFDRL